jgi:transposase
MVHSTSIEPKPHGGGRPPALDESGMARLKALLEAHPDATESELIDLIGVSMSTSAMGRAICKLGYRRKKDAQGGGAGAAGRARAA